MLRPLLVVTAAPLLAAFLCVAFAAAAHSQSIAGRVVDSTTRAPVARANVSLVSGFGAVGSTRTDDSGRFQLTVPGAGSYTVRVRLVGYAPFNRTIQLGAGETVRPIYTIARIPVSLDTVVTRDRTTLFNVTPGRVKYAEHMKLNIGQYVSGLEIQRSKMGVLEYLGTVPGLRYLPGVPMVVTKQGAQSAPPVLPGLFGTLRGSDGRCLYGRIDHWPAAYLLYTQSVAGLDELIEAEDIMGVEVFAADEVPKEWRFDAYPDDLVWRHSNGRGYVMGNGVPKISQAMLTGGFLNLNWRTPPADTLRIDAAGSPQRCAFVQIWTRISW
jgi:hypothetical protein